MSTKFKISSPPPGERIKVRGPAVLARRLRQQPTWAECKLWTLLRNRRFATFKFRRQHPLGPYVLDFFCAQARLAIELDGDVHGHPTQRVSDTVRDRHLTEQGIRMIRFWNYELHENMESVLDAIFAALTSTQNPHPDPLPSRRERGQTGRSLLPRGGEGQDEGAGFAATKELS
jgi:very-short-patch-repair endonuclease